MMIFRFFAQHPEPIISNLTTSEAFNSQTSSKGKLLLLAAF